MERMRVTVWRSLPNRRLLVVPVPRTFRSTNIGASYSSTCPHLTRCYSTEPAPPPLLSKIKGDLKAAMKAKDSARLTVLRSVLSATLNASKSASPIRTDAQLVALLRKQARSAQDAVSEFRAAGRQDLVEKEEAQIRILEEYARTGNVDAISGEELRGIVAAVQAELAAEGLTGKAVVGETMKRLLAPGGPLDGKDVERAEVAKLVRGES